MEGGAPVVVGVGHGASSCAFAQLAAVTVVRLANPVGTLPPGGTVGVLHKTRLLNVNRCRSSIPCPAISFACPRALDTPNVRSEEPITPANSVNNVASNEIATTISMMVKPPESSARTDCEPAHNRRRQP